MVVGQAREGRPVTVNTLLMARVLGIIAGPLMMYLVKRIDSVMSIRRVF